MLTANAILSEVQRGELNTPSIRAVRKRVSKQIANHDRREVLKLAHDLIRRAPFGRFIAYELAHHHAETMRSITVAEVEALGAGVQSWADVDTFAIYIAGPAWRSGRISDGSVRRWAKADDRWQRRAALVSTVPLNATGPGECPRTFAIAKMLLDDRDDMVVKAMLWALRALAKRAPDEVAAFLADHRDQLAARVLREVGNKLATGLKNPKKR